MTVKAIGHDSQVLWERECPVQERCVMFSTFRQTPGMNLWIPLFCRGNHYECARFQLEYRGHAVHERLLPNGDYLP